jgi:hypothetical protein
VSKEEDNKALMRRWYDEMWANLDFARIPELAGPIYTRHDLRGTRSVTAKDQWEITDFKYFLMAEGDYVTSIGTWKINGKMQWDWVQTFRVEGGKLVETWLPAMATEGKWSLDEIPTK